MPESELGAGLTNREYAPLCETMGRSLIAPEVFNCSAPDTGNMEVLVRYGSDAQKKQWLEPLLAGEIRSGFAMTEPRGRVVRRNERRGAHRPRRRLLSNRRPQVVDVGSARSALQNLDLHGQDRSDGSTPSAAVDDLGSDSTRLACASLRPLTVFGYDDAPHGHAEIVFENVRVPVENLLLGEGRGFEIAQGRLGPGRIHHCMRSIGAAERALAAMCERVQSRVAFGKPLAEQGVIGEWIADSRIEIDQARLLTLHAADLMDRHGNKGARAAIAMIKVVAPNVATRVVDRAIQAHGAGGVSNDFGLAYLYAQLRTLRLADGPDEVHRAAIAKLELSKHTPPASTNGHSATRS